MMEKNGGKTLPGPGNSSSPSHLETCGAPVHQLDTSPRLDDRKNGGKTLSGPGNSSSTHLETCGASVHHLDTLPRFDDRRMAEKLCRILAKAAFITLKPVGHQ
jgi:hypothetical protein